MPETNASWLRRLFERRFARFLVVGVLNTGMSYLVYALLLTLGLRYQLANLGSLLIGIAIAFQTQGRLVFGDAGLAKFPLFVVTWVILYGVNIGIIAFWMWLGLDAYIAGLLALPLIAACSFVVQRYVVFRPKEG